MVLFVVLVVFVVVCVLVDVVADFACCFSYFSFCAICNSLIFSSTSLDGFWVIKLLLSATSWSLAALLSDMGHASINTALPTKSKPTKEKRPKNNGLCVLYDF